MKRAILLILSSLTLAAFVFVPLVRAQDKKEPWPGVTKRVIVDNEHVNVAEVTFAPGAVADWHSHPQYVGYAVTDVKMQVEIKGQATTVAELKAGQGMWSPAVTHKTTNMGTKPFTVIVTEIKK